MTRSVFTQILPIALSVFIPALCYAQIDSLKISNNSNTSISFMGDKGECVGQIGPHTIGDISQQDFNKLCKGTNCQVNIYTNYSCAGLREYDFNFNLAYGVGVLHGSYPIHLQAEGFQNNIFITNMGK